MKIRVPLVVLTLLLATAVPRALADDEGAAASPDAKTVVEGLKSDEDATRLAAAEQARDVADDAVTRPLAHLLTDDRFEIRAASIRALGARTTERSKKDAAKALATRLPVLAKSGQDEGEMALAVQALHDLAQPSSIDALMHDVEESTSSDIYRARVMAVANVPAPEAIDVLIRHLASRGRGKWGGNKRSVVEALQYATGERLGADPDAWRAWWRDAKKTFDFASAAKRRSDEAERDREREERRKERGERRRKKKDGDGADDSDGSDGSGDSE